MCRQTLVDERSTRLAQKDRETIVLLNLRFHKKHPRHPDTTLLVYAAGSTQEGSKLLLKSAHQASPTLPVLHPERCPFLAR